MNISNQFKIIFLIRFVGYIVFFFGVISIFAILGPIVSSEFSYRSDQVFGIKHTLPNVTALDKQNSPQPSSSATGGFGDLPTSSNTIVPVDTNFGIVIEKINANAKIVANVNPANEAQYVKALSEGVAAAYGSTPPGEPGNLYLFSHSTDAPWNIVRYNAIFYLLKELEPGDRVVIFYLGRRYDYIVYDKNIVDPTNVSYLTNRYDKPVLTLQTCDPPGTLLNRLIVRAKLENS